MTAPFIRCILAGAITWALLALGAWLDGGPSDLQAEADIAADLRDAIQQAQRQRPDLWPPEARSRAQAATAIAAHQSAREGRHSQLWAEVAASPWAGMGARK